jgi:hypothetical protein
VYFQYKDSFGDVVVEKYHARKLQNAAVLLQQSHASEKVEFDVRERVNLVHAVATRMGFDDIAERAAELERALKDRPEKKKRKDVVAIETAVAATTKKKRGRKSKAAKAADVPVL